MQKNNNNFKLKITRNSRILGQKKTKQNKLSSLAPHPTITRNPARYFPFTMVPKQTKQSIVTGLVCRNKNKIKKNLLINTVNGMVNK